MGTALHDADRRNQCEFGFLLQFLDGESAAVAHGGAHFAQGDANIVVERPGIGDIGIDALFKGEFAVAT